MDPYTDTGSRFGVMIDNLVTSSKLFISESGAHTTELARVRTWDTLGEAFKAARQESLASYEYATVVLIAQPLVTF